MEKAESCQSASTCAHPKLVGALSAGLAILRHLGDSGSRAGVSRIARDLGLNPSTCFNLLRTLVHEGMVSFDPGTKTYALALGVVELAKGALEQASYARFMRPHMEAVSARHGVTATLWQRAAADRMVLVDRSESDATMRVHMQVGQRLPLYVAAFGRCMAAHSGLSRQALREVFRGLRWEQAPPFEAWLRSVRQARDGGYAVDAGHFVRGATTVSSVVLDAAGAPIMALSAVGFAAQLGAAALGEDLAERAATVGRALAGRGAGERGR
jgi:DNA-binding IclR family transcriptional regulator